MLLHFSRCGDSKDYFYTLCAWNMYCKTWHYPFSSILNSITLRLPKTLSLHECVTQTLLVVFFSFSYLNLLVQRIEGDFFVLFFSVLYTLWNCVSINITKVDIVRCRFAALLTATGMLAEHITSLLCCWLTPAFSNTYSLLSTIISSYHFVFPLL